MCTGDNGGGQSSYPGAADHLPAGSGGTPFDTGSLPPGQPAGSQFTATTGTYSDTGVVPGDYGSTGNLSAPYEGSQPTAGNPPSNQDMYPGETGRNDEAMTAAGFNDDTVPFSMETEQDSDIKPVTTERAAENAPGNNTASAVEQVAPPEESPAPPVTTGTFQEPCQPDEASRLDEPPRAAHVTPLAQNNSVSCGQTSVAMCVNSITGKSITDADVDAKYGFGLLNALNAETSDSGVAWKDGGNICHDSWGLIEQKVNQEGTPVIVALNGPEFSASGRGHIVTIIKTEGDTVHFADPATGQMRTTTKQAIESAPSHPDGNFIFYATKEATSSRYA